MRRPKEVYGASSLEEKHMISILLYLNLNRRCQKIEIYHNVSTNPRIPDKLNDLEEMGLITQEPTEGSRATTVSLTPKGIEVANLLQNIDRLIKN